MKTQITIGDSGTLTLTFVNSFDTGHNIYDINRGVTYININTELITVIPREIISRKL